MVHVESMSANTFIWVLMKLAQTSGMLLESIVTACEVLHPSTTASTLQVGMQISAIYAISTRGIEDVYLAEGGVNGDML